MSALWDIQRFPLLMTPCCVVLILIVNNLIIYDRGENPGVVGSRSLTLSSLVAVISSDSDLTLIKICLHLARFS